jgi:hypothetical protein
MLELASICSCSATASARRCAFRQEGKVRRAFPSCWLEELSRPYSRCERLWRSILSCVERGNSTQTMLNCPPPLHSRASNHRILFLNRGRRCFQDASQRGESHNQEYFPYSMIIEWSAKGHAIRWLSQSHLPGLQPRISEEPTESGARIGDRSPRHDPLRSRPRYSN